MVSGAIVAGVGLACVALPCLLTSRYHHDQIKSKLINGVQSVAICNLRSLLDSDPNSTISAGRLVFVRGTVQPKSAAAGGIVRANSPIRSKKSSDSDSNSTISTGRLVLFRGTVQPKSSAAAGIVRANSPISSDDTDYFLSESGEKAVALRRTVVKYYSKDLRDLYVPLSELRSRLVHFHKRYCFPAFYKIPFILAQGGEKPFSDYIAVNINVEDRLIPLEKAGGKYKPVDVSTTNILRPREYGFPVCEWVEDSILPLGQHISAVGICRYENGVPVICRCEDLHYFLTNCRNKDELVAQVSSKSQTLSDFGIFFGMLAFGFFSFAAVTNVF